MHRTRTATSAFSSRDRFGEGFIKCVPRFRRGQRSEPGLEVDHDVVGNFRLVHPSVVLPHQASGPVSLHRSPHLGGSGNSNAPGALRGNNGGTKKSGGAATPSLQDGAKLIALPNPPVPAETGVTGGQLGQWVAFGPRGYYAPRRCRPLARRLLMTSLPPRDLMRTRKPCVLLLRRLLGWNVLFTVFWSPCQKVGTCDVSGYCRDRQNGFGPREARASTCYGCFLSRGKLLARYRAPFSRALWLIR